MDEEREQYLRDKYEFYYDFFAEDDEDEIVVVEKATGRIVEFEERN
jgi:hypothetical protein